MAVGVNAHIAATLLDDVPTDYRTTFQEASTVGAIPADLAEKLAPSVGLRNALVHEYVDIDPAKVASAVPLALSQYGRYVAEVAGFLLRRTESPP